MNCVLPPELNDAQLVAAAEGTASPVVQEHLAQCPYCAARAQEVTHLSDRLTAQLYRLDCPPSMAISEYKLGLLPAPEAAELSSHLEGCPHCRNELVQLSGYLDSLAAELEPSFEARIGGMIARLIRGGGSSIQGLAPLGVRGSDEHVLLYEAEEFQIALEILADPGTPGQSELFGLISGNVPAELMVHLLERGEPLMNTEVDAAGNFVLSGLGAGTYELIISGGAVNVHIPDVQVI